jgi:uncharacterized Zn finger protein
MSLKYKFNKLEDWKCPSCGSNSVALNVETEHQDFQKQYKGLRQLMRCCNCQSLFIFEYKLENIKIHTIKKEY